MSSAAVVITMASVPTIQSSGAAFSHIWRRQQRPRAQPSSRRLANSGKEICSTCIHPVHAKKLREQNFIAHTPAVQLHSHHGRHKLEIAAVNFEADRDADDGETQRRNGNSATIEDGGGEGLLGRRPAHHCAAPQKERRGR